MSSANLVPPPNHTSIPDKIPAVSVTTVKIYEYEDGGEIVGYLEKVYFGPKLRRNDNSERKTILNRDYEKEHCRRASCAIRRRVRNAGLTKLWTFTFPGEGIHDFFQASKLFGRWLNDYGNKFFNGFYVAVPEMHPNGHGWHWHLLSRKYVDVNAVRVSWTKFLKNRGYNPTGGACFVRVHVKRLGSSRRSASYISKYVSKELGKYIPKGKKRYKYGINTILPTPRVIESFFTNIYDTALMFIERLSLMCINKYRFWIYDPLTDNWPCFSISW